MRFAQPEAFALLLLIPLYWFWARHQAKLGEGLPFTTLSVLDAIRRPWPWALWSSSLCFLFFYVGVVTALARPQSGREFITTKQKGIDIMLAIDTSASMLAEDFRPDRLSAARRVIDDFIAKQEGNRLGVVVFAGQSFTLIPLTTDYALVREAVKEVHPQIVKEPGTAIGEAIANALYRFKDDNTGSRVIVLLTDGENTAGETQPLIAAQIARQKDIRIHVIGMGKPEGVPVPVVDPQTGRRVYLRDRHGKLYLSRINEPDLKQIAYRTGGLYFRADNDNKLTAIYEQINQMEKTEFESRKRTVYAEKMALFLWPALGFFLVGILLKQTRAQVLEA